MMSSLCSLDLNWQCRNPSLAQVKMLDYEGHLNFEDPLSHGYPNFWLAWLALSEEEFVLGHI